MRLLAKTQAERQRLEEELIKREERRRLYEEERRRQEEERRKQEEEKERKILQNRQRMQQQIEYEVECQIAADRRAQWEYENRDERTRQWDMMMDED